MAKYTVTYSCGHDGVVELFGPGKERERKLEWYQNVAVCPECYKAQKQAEVAKANEGLVALTGSEKQVAWAMEIRGKYLADLIERLEQTAKARFANVDADRLQVALEAAKANARILVNKVTEAKWWIDNQYGVDAALKQLR